jgi:arylsulfatase A
VGKVEGYSAQIVADEAVRWLKEGRDKSKPFFLTVWTHEPHLLIESDPKFQSLYGDVADPDLRQYYGDVTQLDAAFGTVMKALDDMKLAESTLVVFTSDNGPEGDGVKGRARGSAGGLRGRKRALYEGGIRVPGIVRWLGRIQPGSVCDVPVIGSDLFPTILAAAGLQPPQDRVIDGVNILTVLTQQAAAVERKTPLYWRLHMAPHGLHIAMREGDWKLLASADFAKAELYNLKVDPAETTDLRAKESARFAAMLAALKKLNAEIDADGPDWWRRLDPDGGKAPKNEKKS